MSDFECKEDLLYEAGPARMQSRRSRAPSRGPRSPARGGRPRELGIVGILPPALVSRLEVGENWRKLRAMVAAQAGGASMMSSEAPSDGHALRRGSRRAAF